jgi:hypothetical protein
MALGPAAKVSPLFTKEKAAEGYRIISRPLADDYARPF